jgi:hypothetical protein
MSAPFVQSWPTKAERAELLRASSRRAVDDLAARAAQLPALAQLPAQLEERVAEMRASLPALAPPPAPPPHNRVHLADLKSLPVWQIDVAAIWHDARQAIGGRVHGLGFPLPAHLHVWLREALAAAQRDCTAYCHRSDASLGKLMGCCRDTARKCRLFFERTGVIECVNVMRRAVLDGVSMLVRGANAVLFPIAAPPPAPDDDAAAPAPAAPVSVLERFSLILRPLARWWHRPRTTRARAPP